MRDAESQLTSLREALAASGDVAYCLDVATDAIAWSDGAASVLAPAEPSLPATGRGFSSMMLAADRTPREAAIAAALGNGGRFDCTFRLVSAAGEARWFHDRGVVDRSAAGEPVCIRGVLRGIAGGVPVAGDRRESASYDSLTGLYSYARLREALGAAVQYCQRYGIDGAFLAVGIDKLAVVNEAFGTEVADQVVMNVGERLDRTLRASDAVGRIDGDRFGVVLSNCPEAEIPAVAEKILEVVRETEMDTPSGPIHATVSVGAVSFPGAATTVADTLTKADIALREAKRAGRDRLSVYASSADQRQRYRDSMVIAERVQRAMREQRMTFAYQPIVSSRTREPVCYECLLRLVEPDGSVVPAATFMPVVEGLGLIRPVDRLALELAVRALERDPGLHLALNVSGMTTTDRSWLRAAIVMLRSRPLIAERLIVEITETAGFEDVDACAHFVATLRDLGCRVALDDFGAGYTSFRHLRQLDVDLVKLDGSFVRTMQESRDSLVFVRSLIELARNFGLETIAECVETEEIAERLCAEGVDYLQGYALGVPTLVAPGEDGTRREPAFAAARERKAAL